MITGVWHGKINKQRVEVKIIQSGDSLTGTSYYYESANNYRRYSIKGYFDVNTNAAVWWDDQLLDERSGRYSISTPGRMPMLSRADFNCPGDGKMMLDGHVAKKEDDTDIKGSVHLDKDGNTQFEDEWDYIIDNYTTGTNDPDIIDSVSLVASQPRETTSIPVSPDETQKTVTKPEEPRQKPAVKPSAEPVTRKENPAPVLKPVAPVIAPTIEEKFVTRKKELTKEIPVSGDSIELRFYDNAEIDGDSISLFLNNKLLFEHIRLTGNAYVIKLAVNDLNATNELIMVAENMGTIPPNTSYMVAIVENKRYDAYLASTEGSSAMIKFNKVIR
jgi:hypothetical protein